MKGILIVLSIAAVALARPDIGLTLRGNAPGVGYIPARQDVFTQYGNGDSIRQSTNQYTNTNNFGSEGLQYNRQQVGGGVHVSKNAYFFEGPDDEQAPVIRIHSEQSASHHNHNLIFVKAPSYKAPVIPQIDAQSLHNLHKTRVYVLVKKQDAVQDIVIPATGSSIDSKPEVFFIKYKTQREAEEQIRGIKQGGNAGIHAHNVGSDGAFIRTITDTKENVGSHSIPAGNYHGGDLRSFSTNNNVISETVQTQIPVQAPVSGPYHY